MAEVKLEDLSWDDDAGFDDHFSRFPSFTPAASLHEEAGVRRMSSLHDRFAALTSPSSEPRKISSSNASSNFDLPPTRPTDPTIRHYKQKNGPSFGYSENRVGVFNLGPRESQDQPKIASENEHPSSVQSSGSYKFNPLASTFDASVKKQFNPLKHSSVSAPTNGQINSLVPSFGYTPTKAQLNPFARPFHFPPQTVEIDTTLATAQTGTSSQEPLAYLRQYETSMDQNNNNQKMRITGHFDQGNETPIARSTQQELDERTEFQAAEGSTTESSIEIEEYDSSHGTKSENSDESFKFAPEVEEFEEPGGIIPKVEPLVEDSGPSSEVTNVNPTTRFDNPGFRVIPDTVKCRYPQMAKFLATLIIQETTAINNAAISLPIWGERPNSRTGEFLEESSSQKSVALYSKSSCTLPLNERMREDNHGYDLVRVDTSMGEVKAEQNSKHQKPSEELTTPVEAQGVENIISEVSARDGDMRMMPQGSQETFVVKSTVSKDELFRDSQGSFTIRASSSRRSSISSEGSITFSLMEDGSLSGKESEKADRGSFDDEERSRRSPGPSPSPKRAAGVKSSRARLERFEPLNSSPTGDKKEEGLKIVAEGWLDRLQSFSKNDSVILPTGRPSVLARIHSRESNYDNESDSDGVAPGEWIKPIELIEKRPLKLNKNDERTMIDSLGGSLKGNLSSPGSGIPEKSSGPQSRPITPQTGIQLDKLSEKEKEIVAWRERGIIETTIDGMKTPALLGEDKQGEQGSIPLRQGGLFALPNGNKNHKILAGTLNRGGSSRGTSRGGTSRGGTSRGGSSRGDSSRGGSVIRTQKDDISARWQRFTDQPAPNSQESLALLSPGTQTALKINPENISETKESPFAAKVRKLCPLFFNGPCHQGQSCLDLHPNYDEQSGTFTDKRFATEKAFYEALAKENPNKKTEDALESLIKDSRENALKKSREAQMGGKAGRSRPIGYQVNNVVVKINEKGQQIWNVEPPTEKKFEGEGPKAEKAESDENLPVKQGRRRF